MNCVGLEDKTEQVHRTALSIAREVAEETGTLFAGSLSNVDNIFLELEDPKSEMWPMYEEQARWCKEEGVDYIIAETLWGMTDAKIALEVIKLFDIPAVVTLAVRNLEKKDGLFLTMDGVPVVDACRQLLEMGATLVGVNCSRGPGTIMEVVEQICEVVPPEKVCALPIAFRTTPEEPIWHTLTNKKCPANNPVYPRGFDAFYVSQVEIVEFTKRWVCDTLLWEHWQLHSGYGPGNGVLSKYHDKAALAEARAKKVLVTDRKK